MVKNRRINHHVLTGQGEMVENTDHVDSREGWSAKTRVVGRSVAVVEAEESVTRLDLLISLNFQCGTV